VGSFSTAPAQGPQHRKAGNQQPHAARLGHGDANRHRHGDVIEDHGPIPRQQPAVHGGSGIGGDGGQGQDASGKLGIRPEGGRAAHLPKYMARRTP